MQSSLENPNVFTPRPIAKSHAVLANYLLNLFTSAKDVLCICGGPSALFHVFEIHKMVSRTKDQSVD